MTQEPMAVDAEPPSSPEQRLAGLRHWLERDLELNVRSLSPASSDASFRRYFRVVQPDGSLIAMDAPPAQEDCRAFLAIAWLLRDIGVNAPQVYEVDLERGFMLLSDLGDRRYFDVLDANSAGRLYGEALDALERLQVRGPRDEAALPVYDRAMLLREQALFPEWLLQTHLGLKVTPELQTMLDQVFERVADVALEQPRVCVHRDYHSRNLMVVEDNNPGVLDFQGAVVGPITYDLVSLLRDCYIAWPRSQVEDWALQYLERPARGISSSIWLGWGQRSSRPWDPASAGA